MEREQTTIRLPEELIDERKQKAYGMTITILT